MRFLHHMALAAVAFVCTAAVVSAEDERYADGARYIHEWNRLLTEVMIDDGWTPPIATRHYAYANVAAYEASRPGFPMCRTLEGQLNQLNGIPKPDMSKDYDWRVAAISAYRVIATNRLFRGHRADSLYREHMAGIARQGVAQDVIDRSKAYGDAVGAHVIGWMKGDGYIKITAMSRYVIPKGRGLWEPTEPDFKDPADPFWGDTMRTLTLATSGQFPCIKPYPFSDDKNSDFYKQVKDVYDISQNLTDEQRTIALYWNDNPVYSAHRGHMMYTMRWMTPPGHWINITAIATKMKKLGMMESLETYTMVSLAMFDGFISCWHEKYRSNVMRPVTYIKRYIDSTWQPLIQTPPFPEHTSGHSTVSAAAAMVLTKLLGEFEFTDDTSTPLGFEPRTFKNFLDAAQEASMSRVYGGIHYQRACDGGNKNGREIGSYIVEKVRTRM